MIKISRTTYIITFILAFSLGGYLNISQRNDISIFQAVFLPDSIYYILSGIVLSAPFFFISEIIKNGMKGINGQKILIKGAFIGFCFYGCIAGMDNVNSIYGDVGVLFVLLAFILIFVQVLMDKMKELKKIE